ncbi:MAG: hypothetical protein NTW62_02165 [Candidatus Nomurabacteria bacterium]|nr:hypothetical protein [Candidatus Nomurabacteria bacterium]
MATIKQTLIELFELEKMSPEQATETAERLAKLVMQGVLTRVLPTLSEEDLQKYEEIIDTYQSPEVLFDFLNSKVVNFQDILTEETESLHRELSGEMSALTN